MKKIAFCALFIGAAGLLFLLQAAPIDVQINRYAQKFNLGISKFISSDEDEHMEDEFRSTLVRDLKFSRIFNVVENGPKVRDRPDVAGWQTLGIENVLAGLLRRSSNGRLDVSSKIYDVGNTKEVLNIKSRLVTGDPRMIGHEVANEVVKYFTGQPGIFLSKIAYVNDATGRKELYVADYDGRNPRKLTNDNSIAILPRISPDGKKIIFTSYLKGNPDLYVINSDGTERRRLSAKVGLNVSPSWDPKGNQLAVTLSLDGPPNIYLIDLQGTVTGRLTNSEGADTAPCFSPDGSQIAFTSDRSGAPQIFIMNVDGTGLRRITTVGHCDSAAWSPDGTTIVYVKSEAGNRFDLYSIEVLTGIERRLTWGPGDNENPAWSPDGRFILFVTNRRGKSELFVMGGDGSDQQSISVLKGQSFTPHWSR